MESEGQTTVTLMVCSWLVESAVSEVTSVEEVPSVTTGVDKGVSRTTAVSKLRQIVDYFSVGSFGYECMSYTLIQIK